MASRTLQILSDAGNMLAPIATIFAAVLAVFLAASLERQRLPTTPKPRIDGILPQYNAPHLKIPSPISKQPPVYQQYHHPAYVRANHYTRSMPSQCPHPPHTFQYASKQHPGPLHATPGHLLPQEQQLYFPPPRQRAFWQSLREPS
ncbi:hypothetical protein BCR34DRAFT_591796 [Clohesyomyces aquaticus]|uniref:Uncharacterized protein n=1 Tax=Clohesyomyces aquaticus TaxID=1231657 RepID=A0A1Y1YXV1_9PLEO|nr:hypothetical protein BCR34DRAFT_591796 [Clohesyomyces aquaticus]